MIRDMLRGALAGAAGTTVLNTLTYGDMAVRGRPASDAPAQLADKVADDLGRPVPGETDRRGNRLTGLGALSGIATGVVAGTVAAAARRAGARPPLWLGGLLTGAGAMVATDLPIAALRISDPRTWSARDWVSDALPHLAYGLVTYGALSTESRAAR